MSNSRKVTFDPPLQSKIYPNKLNFTFSVAIRATRLLFYLRRLTPLPGHGTGTRQKGKAETRQDVISGAPMAPAPTSLAEGKRRYRSRSSITDGTAPEGKVVLSGAETERGAEGDVPPEDTSVSLQGKRGQPTGTM